MNQYYKNTWITPFNTILCPLYPNVQRLKSGVLQPEVSLFFFFFFLHLVTFQRNFSVILCNHVWQSASVHKPTWCFSGEREVTHISHKSSNSNQTLGQCTQNKKLKLESLNFEIMKCYENVIEVLCRIHSMKNPWFKVTLMGLYNYDYQKIN